MKKLQAGGESRLTRLLQMIRVLESEWTTRKELSTRFQVSERRINSDLNIIEASGISIERKHGQGYRIQEHEGNAA